jgi:membrane protease subunit HflK
MALNDPNWGKRNNDGPPDLDELWRRFNRKLGGMFGSKGGGNTPTIGGATPMGGFGILLALIGVVWLASGFYIVDASQRGVVLRFGRHVETTQPGPRWHFPWPVETAEVVNVSGVRTVEVGFRNGNAKNKVMSESLMLTDDENIIDLQFAVQYDVKSPEDYLFNNRHAEDSVKQAAESAMREAVGKSKMDLVLYEGREQVAQRAHKLIQQTLDRYKTGINVVRVNTQQTQPPEQVQAAFDDANKANQDRERQKNEGQAYANDVVPKARGAASRLMQEADGYRQRVVATAEGEASRFNRVLAEYSKAPGVMRDRLYLDMMQQVLSNSSKVVVDQKNASNLLFLSLDKILQMTGNTPVAEPTTRPQEPATSGSTSTAPADLNPRSRDALRSREREPR